MTFWVGTDGADTFNGSNSDDVIRGARGDDTLNGLGGNDTFIYRTNEAVSDSDGNDIIDGAWGSTCSGSRAPGTASIAIWTST
ncbi:hypothetical protein [Brevundimonas sp.]|uniref:hypothetical protein n=1 Tax=Brevundimonas sp. TaxID=1871086 RepID=UPI002D31CAC5|nr:hypothetical protein [Brevundimonas sp.]HYC74504.1 hypothetical protein [Brevundimonas sp.]